MKYINPGLAELWDNVTDVSTVVTTDTAQSNTGYYCNVARDVPTKLYMNVTSDEIWFSYDFYVTYAALDNGERFMLAVRDADDKYIVKVKPFKTDTGTYLGIYGADDTLLYTSDKTYNIAEKELHNIEFHFKTGEEGRIDIWIDTKLFCSYRSPSAFKDKTMHKVGIDQTRAYNNFVTYSFYASSFIMQDTRRIGLEKFKMLTVDPATEQNMPQGSTTNFTVSGLSDATEFSDITSFGAIMQTTSKDANITIGTFSLNGSEIGTIDVSDSSGKAYEIAHSETNPVTTKPWTRDDIEGKTLSFTVNGAT